MGLLFNDKNEINENIKNEFGNLDNHLIAFKHNGIKRDFLFMQWHEISSFDIEVKNNKAMVELVHIGKRIGYEIPFNGRIFGTNKANFKKLEDKNWNKI